MLIAQPDLIGYSRLGTSKIGKYSDVGTSVFCFPPMLASWVTRACGIEPSHTHEDQIRWLCWFFPETDSAKINIMVDMVLNISRSVHQLEARTGDHFLIQIKSQGLARTPNHLASSYFVGGFNSCSSHQKISNEFNITTLGIPFQHTKWRWVLECGIRDSTLLSIRKPIEHCGLCLDTETLEILACAARFWPD